METYGVGNARASVREALWFDILSPDSPDNHSLSAWRVAAVDLCAIFLGLTHLVSAIALVFLHSGWSLSPSLANPVLPMSLLLALDIAVIVALRLRDRIGLAPHTVIRCLASYIAASGSLWIVVGLSMTSASAVVGQAFPILMICGGITMAARHRLMRRAVADIDGKIMEIRLRNISVTGAQVECAKSVAPGTTITIDIVGVGPVVGTVRWAQSGKFGVQFNDAFNLDRLAPKKGRSNDVTMLRPSYVD